MLETTIRRLPILLLVGVGSFQAQAQAAQYDGSIRCEGTAIQESFDINEPDKTADLTFIFSFGANPKVREVGKTNSDMIGRRADATYDLTNVRVSDRTISATVRYNFLNSHKIKIGRATASVNIIGLNYTFTGSCERQNRL